MPRYIDADKAKNNERYIPFCKQWYVEQVIDETPTEDVTPVVHAHWTFTYYNSFVCSNCSHSSDNEFCYCPNCGAKMDEEAEDND